MPLRPLARLSRPLQILLIMHVCISALASLVGIYDYHTLTNLPPDVDVSELRLPTDEVGVLIDFVKLFLTIVLAATFLCWIYRASENLHSLSSDQMRFSPQGAVGWYFVPLANLFRPYQTMQEIWHVVHRGTSSGHVILSFWQCDSPTGPTSPL